MKKIFCYMCLTVLMVCLTACANGESQKQKDSVVKKTVEYQPEYKLKETALKDAPRFERDGISVTVTNLSYEDVVTNIHLHIKNETNAPIRLMTAHLSLNGLMSNDSLFLEIPAKSEQDGIIEISNAWFAEMQIEQITDVEFVVKVFDTDNNEMMQSDVLKITTDASVFYRQKYDDSGVIIYSENKVKLSARALKKSKHSDDLELVFYAENNLGSTISIMSEDVMVNGVAIKPTFVISVGAGKKAVDTMVFDDAVLKENGIESIESVEAKFKAFDDNLETVFETVSVKVPISKS